MRNIIREATTRLSPDARNPTTGRMVGLIADLELGRLQPETRREGQMAVACDLTRAPTPGNTLPYRSGPHHEVQL